MARHRYRRRRNPCPRLPRSHHDELWARISERNEFHANDPNSIYFAESDLQRYRARFVPPEADEPHLNYDGDPATVIAALEASRS